MRFGEIKRIVLFGGGKYLDVFLSALLETDFELHVITSPRHAQEVIDGEPFSKILARKRVRYQVADTLEDSSVRGIVDEHTMGVSFGASWLFRPDFIALFGGRLLNYHNTPLPCDRGAGGYSWRILRGDRRGSCLLHQVSEGLDDGDIIRYEPYTYPESCRIPADYLREALARMTPFLMEFLSDVQAGKDFPLVLQDESMSTYYPRLYTSKNGFVDWSWDAQSIERFVCAFDDPYPGAMTTHHGEKVHLHDCRIEGGCGGGHPFLSGLVYRMYGSRIYVACRDEQVSFGRILSEDGEDMMPSLRLGDRLFTPAEDLDNALITRAVYTPQGRKL